MNPITTRGADYAHHITASPPGFEIPAASLKRAIFPFGGGPAAGGPAAAAALRRPPDFYVNRQGAIMKIPVVRCHYLL